MSININYINYLTILIKWIILVLLIIIAVFPVFWILSLSLRPNHETLGRNPTFLPIKWTFENYLMVFGIDVNTDRTQTMPFEALINYITNGAIVVSSLSPLKLTVATVSFHAVDEVFTPIERFSV